MFLEVSELLKGAKEEDVLSSMALYLIGLGFNLSFSDGSVVASRVSFNPVNVEFWTYTEDVEESPPAEPMLTSYIQRGAIALLITSYHTLTRINGMLKMSYCRIEGQAGQGLPGSFSQLQVYRTIRLPTVSTFDPSVNQLTDQHVRLLLSQREHLIPYFFRAHSYDNPSKKLKYQLDLCRYLHEPRHFLEVISDVHNVIETLTTMIKYRGAVPIALEPPTDDSPLDIIFHLNVPVPVLEDIANSIVTTRFVANDKSSPIYSPAHTLRFFTLSGDSTKVSPTVGYLLTIADRSINLSGINA
jgi:hypothetical protein